MKLDPYYAMRSRMQTGDLLLFSGRGLVSRVIRLFTRSRFSHVGIVVNVWAIDALFVYESTTLSRLPDVSSGLRRRGVQMTLLSERLRRFRGGCVWRALECERDVDFWETFKGFRAEMSGRRYERSVRELVRAGRAGDGWDGPTLGTVFCSELVAELYGRWGLWDASAPRAAAWSPAELAGDLSGLMVPGTGLRELVWL